MSALLGQVKATWLGHGTMLFESAGGRKLLVDPWVLNNPATPPEWKKIEAFAGLDLMLITHGHFDHIEDAVAIAKAHKPKIVCIYETAHWLESKGVENISAMNKGGTQQLDGIGVTMTTAHHSCGILDDGKIIYGGEACGYVITFENGRRVYHAGDTTVFQDMALIRELYRPDVTCVPIGDHFTMGPLEAAKALELIGARRAIPMHFGTFPVLGGTPEALRLHARNVPTEILTLAPGETRVL